MTTRMEDKPYYYQYRHMRQITNNPSHPQYHMYGGQGITCYWKLRQYNEFYEWLIATLGERPGPGSEWVLGRKDKSGNWTPGNIEWQNIETRSRTKVRQNVYATYRRKRQALSKWADDLGVPYYTFRRRIVNGKTIGEIIKEFK